MRVAALAFGVLAGLVASLILALGGLDVVTAGSDSADRQAQAIRFGLFVIGNIGAFGAALALAVPLAGGILLVVGAIAWVAAALLLHHSTDFVLITPPALLLVAAVFAIIAHFRRPRGDEIEPDVEIIAPLRARAQDPIEDEDEVAMPAFAAEARNRGRDDDRTGRDDNGGRNETWNPRKHPAPPPRTKPAFREFEDEDEPSGFSRFALGISGVLSFGLYAALAGAAVLIFWSSQNGDVASPAAAAVETPLTSSSAPPAPSSSEPVLAPVLASSAEPSPSAETPAVRLIDPPSVAAAPSSEEDFGDVITSGDPLAPPRLSESTGLPFDETVSSEPAPQPIDLEPDAGQPAEPDAAPVAPTVGPMMPFQMPAQMAALRNAPGTGPTRAAAPAPSGDSGL